MNVLLVSQCAKNALVETRRILDQFAERSGDRTWQTPITDIGLRTLKKLLKKTARRNTSVACHWIKGRNRTELLWIVGNPRKFNQQGAVPTNVTSRDILGSQLEDQWHFAEDIALVSGIAALFHDFGKANQLFQTKLSKGEFASEPYRHEWVSLRLFQAFVGAQTDVQWLTALAQVSVNDEEQLLKKLAPLQDHPHQGKGYVQPFMALQGQPIAQIVAWLILTHHKLPQAPTIKPAALFNQESKQVPIGNTNLKFIHTFLEKQLHPAWNSPQILDFYSVELNKAQKQQLQQVWHFPKGTPLLSKTWRQKAKNIASRALKRYQQSPGPTSENLFVLHIARLALMLADHHFSSLPGNADYRDNTYTPIANTDRKTGASKQRLDEHHIGVYRNTLQFLRLLPNLRTSLPSFGRHPALRRRTSAGQFAWQNSAFDLVRSISQKTSHQGFFGLNMASTGKGKTFANARIMYALADEKSGCRFSVALGLRTLTLQTGDAFRELLHLDEDELAVLIGSAAVRELHQQQRQASKTPGSESAEDFLDQDSHVNYEGSLADGPLKNWLKNDPKLNKLVSAPVLVSTIDHLIPATEGVRGGKQIAPMLRLLTSDLVLDEPDEFGLADLHGLCRLVHWAGLLGSRVLLSSATLSPDLVKGLFAAYQAGYRQHQNACKPRDTKAQICCAWFDEWHSCSEEVADADNFANHHQAYVAKRQTQLTAQNSLRRAAIIQLPNTTPERQAAINAMAEVVRTQIHNLHLAHQEADPNTGAICSFGLVRMANITPLVALATQLLIREPPANTCIHYCVYHSQFPLIMRSSIETQLDQLFNRKQVQAIWQHQVVRKNIDAAPYKHHVFVVLASPVCEVGRDHDYSWAIAEPSSMRAIVQLAGRIQRHRQKRSDQPNFLLLNHNLLSLQNNPVAFTRPGFENPSRPLHNHALEQALELAQFKHISAIPCITQRAERQPETNLADLEHNELALLFNGQATTQNEPTTHHWLQANASLTGELQRRTPFRYSLPSVDYFLQWDEDSNSTNLYQWHENGEPKPSADIAKVEIDITPGNSLWGAEHFEPLIQQQLARGNEPLETLCKTFGAFSLPPISNNRLWQMHPQMGIFRALE